MKKQIVVDGILYEAVASGKDKRKTAKPVKAKKSKVSKRKPNTAKGEYWEGFKVKGMKKHTCSNGKTYNAVKGVTKDGNEMTLVGIHKGAFWKRAF